MDYSDLPSSAFDVFRFDNPNGVHRTGLTGVALKIRAAPIKELKGFSLQSTLTFATSNDLEGTAELPYIDWNGATTWTQFFYDFDIGTNFSLFTEIDFIIENIGEPEPDNPFANRISTPISVIFSYFPNPKTTIYALGGYSPYYRQPDTDYFAQGGIGVKYQISSKFELETLFTAFTTPFLSDTGGNASTINLGARYSF